MLLLPGLPQPHFQNTEAIFRLAPMKLVQFYVTIELARDLVHTLGQVGNVHFRDLNSRLTPFQRTFITELRAIDAVEDNLAYLFLIMEKYGTMRGDPFANLHADMDPLPSLSNMDEIVVKVREFHDRIKQLDDSYNALERQKLALVDNRHVVDAVNNFHKSTLLGSDDEYNFDVNDSDEENDNVALLNARQRGLEAGLETANLDESGVNSILGSIVREKVPLLRKILWRTLRGNLYFHDVPIDDLKATLTGSDDLQPVFKNVFIIFIHGDFLRARVRKIIQSLDGIIYENVLGGAGARLETITELNIKIQDLNSVVASTRDHLITELVVFQESYPDWTYIVQQEKLIYQVLNKFDEDSTRRCLVGEGWIPASDLVNVRQTLRNLVRDKSRRGPGESLEGSTNDLFAIDENSDFNGDENDDYSLIAVVNELSTNRTPPTFHKTNKFTGAFQEIIDAYGVATYQEVNPGLATIITFPFMFAIMFGDIGHGIIVLLIALFLISNEVRFGAMRNKDEIFDMAFSGRYIILLMGLFSIYTGLLYNDIFSKSMTLFSSGWKWEFPESYDFAKDGAISVVAKKIPGKTYLFGLDWAWHGTENNLLFTNSYKMKLSILMGFVHMNYSLFFSLVNYRFFKSRVDIIGNFIPGFLFMQSIFGYLVLTILYKWSVDWLGTGRQPPGLLNMLINMFLSPGKVEEKLYPGQSFVQVVLVLIALVCVPWLLIYKPLTLHRENNKAVKLGYSDIHSQMNHSLQLHEEEEALNHDPPDEVDLLGDSFTFPNDIEPLNHNSSHGSGEEFNLGDVVIHQVIHTIEFCLNCVSHTASYLRLWALSLAHAQLSTVLWSMTIQNAFGPTGTKGIVTVVLLFGLWFVLTVCILVLMEGTSAMLHSLRLHWVEAMSKFFVGEGYAYEPFSLKNIDL